MNQPSARNQEAVFSIFMGLAAILGVWDSRLHYPDALIAFGAFLAFNLLGHVFLRRWSDRWGRAIAAGDTALIAWILSSSGGSDSYFWPMYLLPLFTVCLHRGHREARTWFALTAAALAWSYRDPLRAGQWDRLLDFGVKAAGLGLAAAVAARAGGRERLQTLKLQRSRLKLDRAAGRAAAVEQAAAPLAALDGVLHELGNPLTVILGSTDLLLAEAPDGHPSRGDLDRIRTSVMRCRTLLDCLRAWSGGAPSAGGIGAGELLREMLRLLEHQTLRRRVEIRRELPDGLPAFGARSLPVQQAVLSLMHQVLDRTADGGRLEVVAAARADGIGLRLVSQGLRPDRPIEGLRPCGDMLRRHGGVLETRSLSDGIECDVLLPAQAVA